MRTRRARAYAVLLLLALGLGGCFNAKPTEVAGGGGVETTEGNLAGLAGAAEGARVRVIPAGFDPVRETLPDSLTVTADSNGAFRIRGLKPGRYNVEAFQPKDGTRCFQAGVLLGKGERIPVDTLSAPGRVRLRWDGSRKGILHQRGRAYLLSLGGLESDIGGVTLDSVPAGTLPPFSFVASEADTAARRWTDSIAVTPGALAEIVAYGEWAHQARIDMDLGTIPGDTLIGFPMLVRLSRPAFDFSEAAAGGADMRFTTPAGEALPFEIERWDAAAGRAEIWVRVKSLRLGHAGQSMLMHWGNAPAVAPGAGSPVFDTAAGFDGVWHMDLVPGGAGKFLVEATQNRLVTFAKKLATDATDAAAIGPAQVFDGRDGNAFAENTVLLERPGNLMLSAWIAPSFSNADGDRNVVLAKWEENDSEGYILEFPSGDSLSFTLGRGASGTFRTGIRLPISASEDWHHVAASYDNAETSIWWDGKLIARENPGPGLRTVSKRDIVIGAVGDANPDLQEIHPFEGRIDEARVGRTVHGSGWIGLEYASQRPGAAVIRIQKTK